MLVSTSIFLIKSLRVKKPLVEDPLDKEKVLGTGGGVENLKGGVLGKAIDEKRIVMQNINM